MVGVATDVTQRDPGFFRLGPYHPGQFLPALLRQRRQRHPHHATCSHRVQSQVGIQYGLLDFPGHTLVPWRHPKRTRVKNSDVCSLIQGNLATVIFDADMFKQARMGSPGTDFTEFTAQRPERFIHPLVSIFKDIFNHWASPKPVTSVPSGMPLAVRSNAPGCIIFNTRNGMLFSRHKTMAVVSMTASLRSITSS